MGIRTSQKSNKKKLKWKPPSIGRILPNIVTISALCVGLTSVRFAFLGKWEEAVASILIAGVLDYLDGYLARFFKTSSDFGAELDSLADFINFGVAPSLMVYYFSLYRMSNVGWGVCLFFSACTAMRLARFNTNRTPSPSLYSVGVPAPAGALLMLAPMIVYFSFDLEFSPMFFSLNTLLTSSLMVSRYPTFLLKKVVIPQNYTGAFFVGGIAVVTAILSAPWHALFFIVLGYLGSLPVSGYFFYQKNKKQMEKKHP